MLTFDACAWPAKVSCQRSPGTRTAGHQRVLGSGRFREVWFDVARGEAENVLPTKHCPNFDGDLKIIAAILQRSFALGASTP